MANLEDKVASIYRKAGYNVQRNVMLRDKEGNISEIDVISSNMLKKRYVECKDYKGVIPLGEVARFKEVLRQNKIPLRKGLFVYNGRISKRGEKTGINVISYKNFKIQMEAGNMLKKIIYISLIAGSLFIGAKYNKEVNEFVENPDISKISEKMYDFGKDVYEITKDYVHYVRENRD